jgi:hypothetical protein
MKIIFNQAIKSFGFYQNTNEPCVHKRCHNKVVAFIVIYVDDILLIGNHVGVLSTVNIWLSSQFETKGLGEGSHILIFKLWQHEKKLDVRLILGCIYRQNFKQVLHAELQE